MEFLTKKQLELNAAGYLVSKDSKKPVTHVDFVNQQKTAEYVVKLSEALVGKTFKTGKLDDLEAIKRAVKASMTNDTRSYVEDPTKPVSKVNDEMVEFALNFAKYEDIKEQNKQINTFMNQFNSINDVETVGDYFSEGVVKLAKIYTVAEILGAVKANVATLGNL